MSWGPLLGSLRFTTNMITNTKIGTHSVHMAAKSGGRVGVASIVVSFELGPSAQIGAYLTSPV